MKAGAVKKAPAPTATQQATEFLNPATMASVLASLCIPEDYVGRMHGPHGCVIAVQ